MLRYNKSEFLCENYLGADRYGYVNDYSGINHCCNRLSRCLVISAKSEYNEGGEEVIKTLISIWCYFATLMMVIGGSVSVFMAVADIVVWTLLPDLEDYKRFEMERKTSLEPDQEPVKLTEEELRENTMPW